MLIFFVVRLIAVLHDKIYSSYRRLCVKRIDLPNLDEMNKLFIAMGNLYRVLQDADRIVEAS